MCDAREEMEGVLQELFVKQWFVMIVYGGVC